MSKNKIALLILAILLVVGFWLRIYQIDQVLFSGEEIKYLNGAVGLSETGNFEIWNFQDQGTIKPFSGDKLFTTQIALSYYIFGVSEFSTRLPSILWGLLLALSVYLLAYRLTKNKGLSLLLFFCLVFAEFFVQSSRLAEPGIMYISLFFIGLNLAFLKQKIIKICGGLIMLLSLGVSLSYLNITLITFSEITARYSDFFKSIFWEFRIVWLAYIPLVLYLIEKKPWQNKKYLSLLIFIFSFGLLIPVLTLEYNHQNPYFLIVLPLVWFFSLLGIKFITRHKKEIIFILVALVLIIVPSFPLLPPITPLTHAFIIKEKAEKDKLLTLYQYLEENKLDKTHLISPVDYYLIDYSFAYQKHSSVEKYKVDNIKKYLNKDETGYLIFKKELERKMSHQKMTRIKNSFTYYRELSNNSGYYVFSWGPEEAEKFINYEN